jgi:hypothetical protein
VREKKQNEERNEGQQRSTENENLLSIIDIQWTSQQKKNIWHHVSFS